MQTLKDKKIKGFNKFVKFQNKVVVKKIGKGRIINMKIEKNINMKNE